MKYGGNRHAELGATVTFATIRRETGHSPYVTLLTIARAVLAGFLVDLGGNKFALPTQILEPDADAYMRMLNAAARGPVRPCRRGRGQGAHERRAPRVTGGQCLLGAGPAHHDGDDRRADGPVA